MSGTRNRPSRRKTSAQSSSSKPISALQPDNEKENIRPYIPEQNKPSINLKKSMDNNEDDEESSSDPDASESSDDGVEDDALVTQFDLIGQHLLDEHSRRVSRKLCYLIIRMPCDNFIV
jgi:hypothetical protein